MTHRKDDTVRSFPDLLLQRVSAKDSFINLCIRRHGGRMKIKIC